MSVQQYSAAINHLPKPEQLYKEGAARFIFVYDFPGVFKRQFPTAKCAGIGVITTFEFHINQKGRANVRPTFNTNIAGFEPMGNQYLLPESVAKKEVLGGRQTFLLYGLVFKVSEEDDRIINEGYAKQELSRFGVQAYMTGYKLQENNQVPRLPVSIFADLHHTYNAHNLNPISCSAEALRWKETLNTFKRCGVPDLYLHFVLSLLRGDTPQRASPIYVDPEAYPPEASLRMKKNVPEVKQPVPYPHGLEAGRLHKEYLRKHGVFAPRPPENDVAAKVFEDFHDEAMRGTVDIDFGESEHLKATMGYWNRISERCDDGLDYYDEVRANRGQRPWKHPFTSAGPTEEEIKAAAEAKAAPKAVNKQQVKAVNKEPSNATNKPASTIAKKPSGTVVNKKQSTPKTQNPQPKSQNQPKTQNPLPNAQHPPSFLNPTKPRNLPVKLPQNDRPAGPPTSRMPNGTFARPGGPTQNPSPMQQARPGGSAQNAPSSQSVRSGVPPQSVFTMQQAHPGGTPQNATSMQHGRPNGAPPAKTQGGFLTAPNARPSGHPTARVQSGTSMVPSTRPNGPPPPQAQFTRPNGPSPPNAQNGPTMAQMPPPMGPPPAKKQKVDQPGPPVVQQNPQTSAAAQQLANGALPHKQAPNS